MANEISASATLRVNKGTVTLSASPSLRCDLASQEVLAKGQSIATSATLLDLTGITGAPQKLILLNTETVHAMTVALDGSMTNKTDVIPPGHFILISPYAATRYLTCATATGWLAIYAVGT